MTLSNGQAIGAGDGSECAEERICDAPGCGEPGSHLAPKSRERLRSYYRFCLEHVRAYNLAWNYYKDMSEIEVEAERRRDTVWRRPSWRMGGARGPRTHGARPDFQDPFGIFGQAEDGSESAAGSPRPNGPLAEAWAILGMEPGTDPRTVKARYKTLVKELHPDRTGGDQATLERMKQVNQAYQTLKKSFTR
jgi:DnaJ-domain-containing protein 1